MIPVQEIEKMTDQEVVSLGLATLSRELGLYGYARFLMRYRPGTGDYTLDRHQWLDGLTMEEIVADIKRHDDIPNSR